MKRSLFKTGLLVSVALILLLSFGGLPASAQATFKNTNTAKPTKTDKPTKTAKPTKTDKPTKTAKPTKTPKSISTSTPTATAQSSATSTFTATITATLTPTATATSTFTPTSTSTPTSTATSTSTSTFTPTSTPTQTLRPEADLVLQLTVDNDSPEYWSYVLLTVQITNQGLLNASGVEVSLELPDGLIFVEANSPNYNANTGSWMIGTLEGGADATLQIKARVVDRTLEIQTVSASVGSDTLEANTSNNTDSLTVAPVPARIVPVIIPDPNNPPFVDIGDPRQIIWYASSYMAATGEPPPPDFVWYFWTCDTVSQNPCPFVPGLSNENHQTLAFTINTFQLDTYIITLTITDLGPGLQDFTSITFTTTSSGGPLLP